MLTQYINAAMKRATYEPLEDDGTIYGEIPELQGVWANAETQAACETELQEVLEGWILLGLHQHHVIPVLEGINLNPRVQEVA